MKEYTFIRTDHYRVTITAKNKKEAEQKVNNDSDYLNDGEFLGSDFELSE